MAVLTSELATILFNIEESFKFDSTSVDLHLSLDKALKAAVQVQASVPRESLPLPNLNVTDEEIEEYDIPGEDEEDFSWAIEFGQFDEHDPMICLKTKATSIHDNCTIAIGPIVNVTSSNNRMVTLILEC